MKNHLFFLGLLLAFSATGQNPLLKQWDNTYGGFSGELFQHFIQTNDHGYLLAGYSYSSIGGDKTQDAVGDADCWIAKTDSAGNIQWDKTFGGTEFDFIRIVKQTADGGYILGGESESGIGGDKTEPNRDTSWQHSRDFWIIKTDASGNKVWDKTLGGSDDESISWLDQTSDGGYIICGSSASPLSGDKTELLRGRDDYWIVKIDSLGNKEWDKTFGGTEHDWGESIHIITGGYLVFGTSRSEAGGDKTQNSVGYDYWILKLNDDGTKMWDRVIGGNRTDNLYSVVKTIDGGFLLGGTSNSDISGDKTQANWGSFFTSDYWIVKIDSLGNVQWDKRYGGSSDEEKLVNVIQTNDSGFLISGASTSALDGDKTEKQMRYTETWLIKVDSIGNKQWDKSVFSPSGSYLNSYGFSQVVQSDDGCFEVVNYSELLGAYITHATRGNSDFRMIKFCETSSVIANFFTNKTAVCPGSGVSFWNASSNSTSVQWEFEDVLPLTDTFAFPSRTYVNPGLFDVKLIASNGNMTDTLSIPDHLLVFDSIQTPQLTQVSNTLFATAGYAYYTWYLNGSVICCPHNDSYLMAAPGDYTVVCTDSNGCEASTTMYNVHIGIKEYEVQNPIQVFPSPASTEIYFRNTGISDDAIVRIYNLLGEICLEKPFINSSASINISRLNEGIYHLEVVDKEKIFRAKFVIGD